MGITALNGSFSCPGGWIPRNLKRGTVPARDGEYGKGPISYITWVLPLKKALYATY